MDSQFVDQISSAAHPEYVFHHPLIRTVAYESQLKSGSRRAASTGCGGHRIRWPEAAEENAALIAEHLEAAGDLYAAYGWHMRAAAWARSRDIIAARSSWERARTSPTRSPTRSRPDRHADHPAHDVVRHAYRVRGNRC